MQGRDYSADGGLNGRLLGSWSKKPDRGSSTVVAVAVDGGIRGHIHDLLTVALMVTKWLLPLLTSNLHKISPKVDRKGAGGKGISPCKPLFFLR